MVLDLHNARLNSPWYCLSLQENLIPVPLQVAVMVSYLQSYSGMGQARVACDAGCTCKAAVIDAYTSQETSTTFMKVRLVLSFYFYN